MAQRLFDRIIFIAFCEDRGLLPEKTIPKAYSGRRLSRRHQSPLAELQEPVPLHRRRRSETHGIHALQRRAVRAARGRRTRTPDDAWTTSSIRIGSYDFADEVNLDVLGHLFERSITELEKLKESGLFGGDAEKAEQYAAMPQSAKRKRLGIYYTPPELTSRIVQYTVEELIARAVRGRGRRVRHSEEEAAAGAWRPTTPTTGEAASPSCGTSRSSIRPAAAGRFCSRPTTCWKHRYHEVIGHLEQSGEPEDAEATRRHEVAARSFCRKTSTASISRPRRSRSRNWPSGFARPRRGNCWRSCRRTSSTATRWSTTPKSTRPVSIGSSGFPDVFEREEAGLRLRDRQSAVGADQAAGAGVLLAARPRRSPPPPMRPNAGSWSPSWNPTIRHCTSVISRRWKRPMRC